MIENQHLHSSTVTQYLCTQPRKTRTLTKAMNARQKWLVAGPTTGCWTNQATCIEEKQWVRQPAVRYTHKNKPKQNKYINTHEHKYACWYVWLYEERQRIRVQQQAVRYTQKSKQTIMHACVSVYAYTYEERERISVTLVTTAAQGFASDLCMCASACECWYYFANLSTLSVCLPVHTVAQTHTHTQATQK
jgi:hypothetical protein